jgi:hypothetical protein
VCTLGGLPVAFALTGAKADERQTLLGIFAADPALVLVPQTLLRVGYSTPVTELLLEPTNSQSRRPLS